LKIYKKTRQPILLREKKNINPILHQKTEFAEVRETIKSESGQGQLSQAWHCLWPAHELQVKQEASYL